jgi:hypothetical protein
MVVASHFTETPTAKCSSLMVNGTEVPFRAGLTLATMALRTTKCTFTIPSITTISYGRTQSVRTRIAKVVRETATTIMHLSQACRVSMQLLNQMRCLNLMLTRASSREEGWIAVRVDLRPCRCRLRSLSCPQSDL